MELSLDIPKVRIAVNQLGIMACILLKIVAIMAIDVEIFSINNFKTLNLEMPT